MKDEEMAEEYLNEKCKDCYMCSYSEHKNPYKICQRRKDRKQAFLAGLKAGRLQWHKVKDELPTDTGLYLIFYYNSFFRNKVRCIARYSPDRKEFLNLNIEDGDEVIAWQELPALPKESE